MDMGCFPETLPTTSDAIPCCNTRDHNLQDKVLPRGRTLILAHYIELHSSLTKTITKNLLIPDSVRLIIRMILWLTVGHNFKNDSIIRNTRDHVNGIWNYFPRKRKISQAESKCSQWSL